MGSILGLAIAAVFVLAIANAMLGDTKRRRGGADVRVVRRPLMSASEHEFWHVLRHAAAPLHVGPQVAMNALLQSVGGDRSRNTSTRNRYNKQVVDFVLFDDDGHVELIIELDDRTHDTKGDNDRARDARTDAAGYTTLRIRKREARSVAMLAGRIAEAVPTVEFPAAIAATPTTAPHRAQNMSARPSSRRA